jgi:hypothetical protein
LGVLGEAIACQDRLEITQWGGWRAYKNRSSQFKPRSETELEQPP